MTEHARDVVIVERSHKAKARYVAETYERPNGPYWTHMRKKAARFTAIKAKRFARELRQEFPGSKFHPEKLPLDM